MIHTSVASLAPSAFLHLVWEVFFNMKNRGTSLEAHFPWLTHSAENIWYVLIYDNCFLIGGLCVKKEEVTDYNAGSIGLVCIAPEYRGRGYAKEILETAIKEAKKRNYDALTLWTSKHDVYAPQGFRINDNGLFGTVNLSNCGKSKTGLTVTPSRQNFPAELGLPPFAKSGFTVTHENAQAIFIEDNNGIILADWKGNLDELVELLIAMPERQWRINAHNDDQLLEKLAARKAILNLMLANLQMWLPLKPELINFDWSKIFRFSVLDRI